MDDSPGAKGPSNNRSNYSNQQTGYCEHTHIISPPSKGGDTLKKSMPNPLVEDRDRPWEEQGTGNDISKRACVATVHSDVEWVERARPTTAARHEGEKSLGWSLPVILTAKPWAYGGSRIRPALSSATILQASENAATHPNSTTIDSPRPSAFCTAAPPGEIRREINVTLFMLTPLVLKPFSFTYTWP